MEPGNNPNVSAALSAAPINRELQSSEPAPAVEPSTVQEPAQEPAQPMQQQEPAPQVPAEPQEQNPPELPENEPEPTEPAPEHNAPEYVPESYNSFLEAANKMLTDKGINTQALADSINAAGGKVTAEVRKILEGKLGAAEATMLITGYEAEISKVNASIKAEAEKVYEIVGGEEEWNKIAAWAKTPEAGLDPEAKVQYNAMLAQGGVQAALAAKAIKEAYMASPGFTQDANLMQGQEPASAPSQIDPISRSEYINEKRKAVSSNDGVAVAALEERARFTMEHHAEKWRGGIYNG